MEMRALLAELAENLFILTAAGASIALWCLVG
jgi:hypothetical protein